MKIWLAELIGTFALVFVGVGAIAAELGVLGVALAFGFVVAVMIAAVGPVSAAHFNPAVTIGFLVMRRILWWEVIIYWSAQVIGAIIAMLLLKLAYGPEHLNMVGYGVTKLASGLHLSAGITIEIVLTFFLMFVIASVVIRKHVMDGLYIGFTVGMCALIGGTLTGASMNPARSFGPALISGVWTDHWIYWLGPITGAIIAVIVAQYLYNTFET